MRLPVARIQRCIGPSLYRSTARGNALETVLLPVDAWVHMPASGEDPLAVLQEGFEPSLTSVKLLAIRQGATLALTIESAQELPSGAWLYLEDASFKEPDALYFYEIRGLAVQDEDGRVRGRIVDYMETGASGVLVLDLDGKEVLVPVAGGYVEFKAGYVLVRSLEDFL